MLDKETFYERLVRSLLRADFRFRADDLSQTDVATDKGKLFYVRRTLAILPKVLAAIPGSPLSEGMVRIHSIFDREKLQQRLDGVRDDATLVCFKYVMSQPIILAAVEADHLGHGTTLDLASKFDQALLQMRDLTAKMGGLRLGKYHVGATRLGVFGILLFVFFDHSESAKFIENTRKHCRRSHFLKKIYLDPWVIDVDAKQVRSDNLLSAIRGMGLEGQLQKDVFGRDCR